MEIIRRNTDYALRAMAYLAQHYTDHAVSTKEIADMEHTPYLLLSKLLQKLHKAKLVKSVMGPKGGFQLFTEPKNIKLTDVIMVIQGPVKLNKCLLNEHSCPVQNSCTISKKLMALQDYMDSYLSGITLADLLKERKAGKNDRIKSKIGY